MAIPSTLVAWTFWPTAIEKAPAAVAPPEPEPSAIEEPPEAVA
jgi:hypothetical protein